MKKAQMMGQIFVLIIAAAVFILILLYGYRAISGFTERSEQVALIEFETELKSSVKQIAIDFGSVKKLELSVPTKHKNVCFVDLNTAQSLPGNNDLAAQHPLIWDSVISGVPQNVFLEPPSDAPINVERIQIDTNKYINGFFCATPIEGKITLRLEGLGDKTGIDEWPKQ